MSDSRKDMPRGYNAGGARALRVEATLKRLARANALRVKCPRCPLMIDPANLPRHIEVCHED